MIKMRCVATKDYEIMDLIHLLKSRGAEYEVKPPTDKEAKQTKEGKPIRWINIKHI